MSFLEDKMEIKGAIFDLDGTLLDSMCMWDNLTKEYLFDKGIDASDELYKQLSSLTLEEASELFIKQFNIPISPQQVVQEICEKIDTFYSTAVLAKTGTKELLEDFTRRNIPLCIATATEKVLVEKALERTGLGKYFKMIFTCPDVGVGKELPDIYDRAMEFLGTTKENTLVFEDAYHAVKTATSAGYTVVGLYDNSSKNHWEEIKKLCAVTFNSLEEWDESLLDNSAAL